MPGWKEGKDRRPRPQHTEKDPGDHIFKGDRDGERMAEKDWEIGGLGENFAAVRRGVFQREKAEKDRAGQSQDRQYAQQYAVKGAAAPRV